MCLEWQATATRPLGRSASRLAPASPRTASVRAWRFDSADVDLAAGLAREPMAALIEGKGERVRALIDRGTAAGQRLRRRCAAVVRERLQQRIVAEERYCDGVRLECARTDVDGALQQAVPGD